MGWDMRPGTATLDDLTSVPLVTHAEGRTRHASDRTEANCRPVQPVAAVVRMLPRSSRDAYEAIVSDVARDRIQIATNMMAAIGQHVPAYTQVLNGPERNSVLTHCAEHVDAFVESAREFRVLRPDE